MKTIKKLHPGLKGTKKLVAEYGDKLVCVRYRHDYEHSRKVKTIELIVSESPLQKSTVTIPMTKIMKLEVKYGEISIRRLIKAAGGNWNRKEHVWELPYKEVLALGLENRIVNKKEKYPVVETCI